MAVAVGSEKYGLTRGKPELKSVGALAFGPDGILFAADNSSATIFAIDVADTDAPATHHALNVEDLDGRLAAYLGCGTEDVAIRDMAVHPTSENVYLSVMRGAGDEAIPVIVKITADGTLSEVELDSVPFASTTLTNAPSPSDERTVGSMVNGKLRRDPLRTVTVTDMSYLDGELLVAGTSNEEFSSSFRRIPFPFQSEFQTNSLEIFHVSHGRYETASPIRAFQPYRGANDLVASYACTPVVHFSMAGHQPGDQVKGRTVAELGSGNVPLSLVSFKQGEEQFILVSGTKHPLIKINCADIDRQEGLTTPSEPVGVPRENLPHAGVTHMANLNGSYVLMLQSQEGRVSLRSYETKSL